MYNDDFFKNNKWYWGDNIHWAYSMPEFIVKVDERDAINWTPNTIASEVVIDGNEITVKLLSDTPNLKEYQMKALPSESWEPVSNVTRLSLNKEEHEFVFRAVNLAGISGPEHRVLIGSR
jgi:hypothetical protein